MSLKTSSGEGASERVSDPDFHVTMTMNKDTFYVLQEALELYIRLGMGQLDELAWFWLTHKWGACGESLRGQDPNLDRKTIEEALNALYMPIYGIRGPGTSYGIANPSISDVFRVACDARDALRYQVAWFKQPEGGFTVDFGEPMHHSHKGVPLPEVLVLTKEIGKVKVHQKNVGSSRIR